MGRLDGKVAFITGGASGIGRAAAKLFAVEGARVAIFDILQQAAESSAHEASPNGDKVIAIKTDVTDPDSMTWDVTFVAPNERRVQLRVKAGNIYWVSIWSANAPGEPFLLTASLQAD